jgi:hypothetical protein
MRRLAFSLLIVALLAACSSAPQKSARNAGSTSEAGGAWRTTPPPGFPHFVDHSVGREEISIQAMSLVGVPYRWGGNTPDSGFDCSGLVHYVVLRAASVNLPRTTADMSVRGETIEPDQIAPGDLIFFNTTGRPHSHVGIYVGKLRFVNAPSTGGTVRLDYLTNPYWAKRFDGIRRVAPATTQPAPFETPTYQASVPLEKSPPASAVPPSVVTSTSAQQTPVVQQNAPAAAAYAPPPATASADPFEPPPAGLSAAQMQAKAAGAAPPEVAAPEARTQPDAIDAAADAFEPPPPAAVAAQQAQQARQAQQAADPSTGVKVIRASTPARGVPAPTQSSDDPIAGFASGSY